MTWSNSRSLKSRSLSDCMLALLHQLVDPRPRRRLARETELWLRSLAELIARAVDREARQAGVLLDLRRGLVAAPDRVEHPLGQLRADARRLVLLFLRLLRHEARDRLAHALGLRLGLLRPLAMAPRLCLGLGPALHQLVP